jgi:hypothetical protein
MSQLREKCTCAHREFVCDISFNERGIIVAPLSGYTKINLRDYRSCSGVHLDLQLRYLKAVSPLYHLCSVPPPGGFSHEPNSRWVFLIIDPALSEWKSSSADVPWGNALIFQHSTQANPSHKRRRLPVCWSKMNFLWSHIIIWPRKAELHFGRKYLEKEPIGNVLLRGGLRISAIEKFPLQDFYALLVFAWLRCRWDAIEKTMDPARTRSQEKGEKN